MITFYVNSVFTYVTMDCLDIFSNIKSAKSEKKLITLENINQFEFQTVFFLYIYNFDKSSS